MQGLLGNRKKLIRSKFGDYVDRITYTSEFEETCTSYI
jgi:hypothetical protein